MDLRQLRHFMALAKSTRFYEAAESVGVTQSALTQSVSKLEKELELRLFMRSKTGTVLTEHGQKLYDHAKVITAQIEAALMELRAQAQQAGAEIRVGIIQSLDDQIVIDAITRFKQIYPRYDIKIIKDWSAALATLLTEGEIDFAFLSDHFMSHEMPEIKREILFVDHVRAVIGEKHELYRFDQLTLADLASHQWVAVSTRPDWPQFLARVFASTDILKTPQLLRTNSMTLSAALIRGGHAIGMLSQKLFRSSDYAGRVKYYAIPEIDHERRFSICRRARMVLRPFHEQFLECLRGAILAGIDVDGLAQVTAPSLTPPGALYEL